MQQWAAGLNENIKLGSGELAPGERLMTAGRSGQPDQAADDLCLGSAQLSSALLCSPLPLILLSPLPVRLRAARSRHPPSSSKGSRLAQWDHSSGLQSNFAASAQAKLKASSGSSWRAENEEQLFDGMEARRWRAGRTCGFFGRASAASSPGDLVGRRALQPTDR